MATSTKPWRLGKLFSIRHGAYSVVVAASDAAEARWAFQSWLAARGINVRVESLPFPKSTRSIGERLLLLADDRIDRELQEAAAELGIEL